MANDGNVDNAASLPVRLELRALSRRKDAGPTRPWPGTTKPLHVAGLT